MILDAVYHARGSFGTPGEELIVFLNFSDREAEAWVPWPSSGEWRDLIDERDRVQVASDGEWKPVRVPSNYGAVYGRV